MENAELFQQCLLSGGFEFRRWCARCRADAAQISGHAPGMAHALNVRSNVPIWNSVCACGNRDAHQIELFKVAAPTGNSGASRCSLVCRLARSLIT
jgi:hypothetical protein